MTNFVDTLRRRNIELTQAVMAQTMPAWVATEPIERLEKWLIEALVSCDADTAQSIRQRYQSYFGKEISDERSSKVED